MARTLDRAAHAHRRDAFVDVAQRLIQTRGYERFSIQDVLDEMGASKGALYHYFGSKQDLLEAVVDRIAVSVDELFAPIAADPALSALDKLQRFFSMVLRWKTERKDLLVALLRVWRSDDNILVREKVVRGSAARLSPRLAEILKQGTNEGTFALECPEETAPVIVSLIFGLGETMADQFLGFQAGEVELAGVERTVVAHSRGLERILGAPPGSLTLVDEATLNAWYQ